MYFKSEITSKRVCLIFVAVALAACGGPVNGLDGGDTEPAPYVPVKPPELSLELWNTAGEARECMLSVTHQGVRRDLYHGTMQPGERRAFGPVATEPIDFQAEVHGGCISPDGDPRGVQDTLLAVGMRQTCTLTYYEPVAVLLNCRGSDW